MEKLSYAQEKVFYEFFKKFGRLKLHQEKCIPLILEGKNVVLSAGTGSGKTEAVLVPLIMKYIDELYCNMKDKKDSLLKWVYIVPTKALANDILKRIEPTLSSLDINVSIRHGEKDQTKRKSKTNFLITTPESLEVLILRDKNFFKNVKALILDEAHIFYNTQRGFQLSILISRIKKISNNNLQIACISATMPSYENIIKFFFGNDNSFCNVNFPSERLIEGLIKHIQNENEIIEIVSKILYFKKKILIFANSRKDCDYIFEILSRNEYLKKVSFIHHSSISKDLRQKHEESFNKNRIGIMVSTSTLEVGIDIGDIDEIILYGPPSNVSSFLQRVGRGNRKENKINVTCIVPLQSKNVLIDSLVFYALIELSNEGFVENNRPMKLYGSIVQQILSIIYNNNGRYTSFKYIADFFSHHEYISNKILRNILDELTSKNYLRKHPAEDMYGAAEGLYYMKDKRLIYSNIINCSANFELINNDYVLGSISMIGSKIKEGNIIKFAGKFWKIKQIYNKKIFVEHSSKTENFIEIKYYSKLKYKICPLVLNRVYEYLEGREIDLSIFGQNLKVKIMEIKKQSYIFKSKIPRFKSDRGFFYLNFGGFIINSIISKILNIKDNYNDVMIFLQDDLNFTEIVFEVKKNIEKYVMDYMPVNISIFQSLLPENLLKEEFLEYWLSDNEIFKILDRLIKSEIFDIDKDNFF